MPLFGVIELPRDEVSVQEAALLTEIESVAVLPAVTDAGPPSAAVALEVEQHVMGGTAGGSLAEEILRELRQIRNFIRPGRSHC